MEISSPSFVCKGCQSESLCSFLPSLMFKNSLQLWCFFGVGRSAFTLPALARTASLCAAFKRERERLVHSVVNIPNVFKLS